MKENPEGRPGEIRLRFTATVDGHEYLPIVESCDVEPPPQPARVWRARY